MAEWFRHDTDARNDIKIKKLARDVGLAGVGAFWIVAEVLFEHGGVAQVQDIIDELDFFGDSEMFDKLVHFNLIQVDGETVTSHRVLEEITFQDEARQKKSEAGKKGMASRWGNRVITADNTVITKDNKGYQPITDDNTLPDLTNKKDISLTNVSSILKEKSQLRFVKPSVNEVRAYCDSRNNGIDAEAFCDFYESKGWKVGNTPMKDWQAAVRTWEKAGSRAPQYQSTRKRMVTDKTERSKYVNADGTLNLLGGLK